MEVKILQTFWTYPEGKSREEYAAGFTVTASVDDAKAWIAKGLAEAVQAAVAEHV